MPSLTGQLLVAMPQMSDPFFDHSVVYLCAHGEETGAMGLVVNKTIDALSLDELYAQLKIEPVARSNRPVHFGGPVAAGQGFVLHSADYRDEGTLAIGEEFAMTATLDILRAQSKGEGPRQGLVALGYAGWGPGQLESEIQANGWLVVDADPALVFETEDGSKWQRALAKLGVSPEMLSGESGRA
ncbi:MAG TPA: YqgE/AlgH family protein [Rhizomicrobium sp.]|nr:YqgE/AlgH family protein [Rhizomicrobium sp.]